MIIVIEITAFCIFQMSHQSPIILFIWILNYTFLQGKYNFESIFFIS